jgi:cholesterol transport system auxiliary component
MTVLRLAAAACAALALGACAIGKPIPHANTYVVEPPQPAPAATRRPETLRMGNVRVAPAFDGRALVYRLGEVQYTEDFYNSFIAEPGALLGSKMAAWLDRAGPFQAVAQPGAPLPASHVLDAVVTELYGDFRPDQPPAAVMTIQFSLVDLRGVRPRAALERSIGRRIRLAEDSPDALVQGYGQALGEILAELAPQLAGESGK